jgi:hypothetical protein
MADNNVQALEKGDVYFFYRPCVEEAAYPKKLMQAFRGRRFANVDPLEPLLTGEWK